MSGFIHFFTEEMGKEVIELTCAGMVNILKYVPGVQAVDYAVRLWFLALIPAELKTQTICEESVTFNPYVLAFVSDHFKTKRMCEYAVEDNLWMLRYDSDHSKTKKMCKRAVKDEPESLKFDLDHFETKRMCERALRMDPCNLEFVSDYLKTQKICDKPVKGDPYSLLFVPDWFVTQKQIKIWHDNDGYCNDDEFIEWYKGHQNRKAQKAKIKEELLPIAYYPSRYWDWCMPEDEKKKNCGDKQDLFGSGDRIQNFWTPKELKIKCLL